MENGSSNVDKNVIVKILNQGDSLDEIFEIRRRVFQEEQKVRPSTDLDGLDKECVQFLATMNGRTAGTCRLRIIPPLIKMQRIAVYSEFRGKGVAGALLREVANYARNSEPKLLLVALTQLTAAKVYEKAGWIYVDEEKVIWEENMPHKYAILPPKTKEELNELQVHVVQSDGVCDLELLKDIRQKLAEIISQM